MQKPRLNVFKNNLCIGCGVCESKCPKSVLKVKESDGSYIANIENNNCTQCNICLKNCIFSHEDFLKYKIPDEAYIGYDLDVDARINSASGGMLTLIVKYLKNNKKIDGVVTAKYQEGKFVYSILTEYEDIDKARGSVYMPLYHNDIWNQIKDFKGNLAFIGTPCYCEAAHMLKNNDKTLEKIKYIFSLVCGHMPSKNATINFLNSKGINVNFNEIIDMKYRGQGWPGGGYIKFSNGRIFKFDHTDIWSYKNMSSSYTYNRACSSCNDLWGSYSDAAFADYWEPEFMKEKKGYNLIMVHNKNISKILQNIKREQKGYVKRISVENGINTQNVPVFIKTVMNNIRRDNINGKNIKLNYKVFIRLEEILKKRKYNAISYKVLNKITWNILNKGVKKYAEDNGNKSL